ncbi:hypothetical protein ACFV23_22915 [Streptomyces sp. NPDC059627]|uniref:hypothetical protein n=1 Tax=Streptomyces sp. NPDC001980 TaxID=3157126 RepID=UPI00332A2B0C
MRHAAPRKSSRIGTTFRTAAVSAFALGSLTVAAGSQVHAAAATSHSTTDDSARTQKRKADAVAAAAKGQTSRPVTDPEAVRVLKMKTVAIAHAPKG